MGGHWCPLLPTRKMTGSFTILLLLAGIVAGQNGDAESALAVDDSRLKFSDGWNRIAGTDPCNLGTSVATSTVSNSSVAMTFDISNDPSNELLIWGARQANGAFMTITFDGATSEVDTSQVGEGANMCAPLAMIQNFDITKPHTLSIVHGGPGNGVSGSGTLTINGFTIKHNDTVGKGDNSSPPSFVTSGADLVASSVKLAKVVSRPSGANASPTSSAAGSSLVAPSKSTLVSPAASTPASTASSSAVPAADASKDQSKGTSPGLIAGIVVVVLILLVLAFGVFVCMRRKQRRVSLETGVWTRKFFRGDPSSANTSTTTNNAMKISGPSNFVHKGGSSLPGGEEMGLGEHTAHIDSEKHKAPAPPPPAMRNVRQTRNGTGKAVGLPMPQRPGAKLTKTAPPSQPAAKAVPPAQPAAKAAPPARRTVKPTPPAVKASTPAPSPADIPLPPATPQTASPNTHPHRKPIPAEVHMDELSPTHYSDSDYSPLEPPTALRPGKGLRAMPASPAQTDIMTYNETVVTARATRGVVASAKPTIVSI